MTIICYIARQCDLVKLCCVQHLPVAINCSVARCSAAPPAAVPLGGQPEGALLPSQGMLSQSCALPTAVFVQSGLDFEVIKCTSVGTMGVPHAQPSVCIGT